MTRYALFTLGDWSICKMPKDKNRPIIKIFAHHITCKEATEPHEEKDTSDISWLKHEEPKCYCCSSPVPDTIQGLMQLHEWDHK